jgi:hypothetical protein
VENKRALALSLEADSVVKAVKARIEEIDKGWH